MNPELTVVLATLHQQDLLDEAARDRFVRAARRELAESSHTAPGPRWLARLRRRFVNPETAAGGNAGNGARVASGHGAARASRSAGCGAPPAQPRPAC